MGLCHVVIYNFDLAIMIVKNQRYKTYFFFCVGQICGNLRQFIFTISSLVQTDIEIFAEVALTA